jgi:hypothetical protein
MVCQKSLKDAAILHGCQSRGRRRQQARGVLLLSHGDGGGRERRGEGAAQRGIALRPEEAVCGVRRDCV